MIQDALEQGLRIAFYLGSGAILLTFFIVTLIEGILAQTSGYALSATVFYFIAMISLGASYWTYYKAKKMLRTLT